MTRQQVRRLPLELDRIGRAMTLRADLLEGMTWQFCVQGDEEIHFVDLRAGDTEPYYWTCDCGDFTWRDVACKHICSALIAANDDEAVSLMFEWIRRSRNPRPESAQRSEHDIDIIIDGEV